MNKELGTTPQPRVSLKVAFFLTDTTEVGAANMYVIPGSQVKNQIDFPADPLAEPADGIAVRAPRGSAVFFDRRIWHASSPNYLSFPRKVLFYGYSYRWLRPRDNMTVAHYAYRSNPIRQQLMGVSHSGNHGYTSPQETDVPLRILAASTWRRSRRGLSDGLGWGAADLCRSALQSWQWRLATGAQSVTSHYVSGAVRFLVDARLYRRYNELTDWTNFVQKHFPGSEIPKNPNFAPCWPAWRIIKLRLFIRGFSVIIL